MSSDPNKPFICKNVMPGFYCGYPEMDVLGIIFWLTGLVSILLLFFHIRSSKSKCKFFDQTFLFWIFMIIWQFYRGTVQMFKINWTPMSFIIGYTSANHILLFIPMCLVILILFDLLFTYRNPGMNAIIFFRSLFILFLITFVGLGLTLCIFDTGKHDDPDLSLSLWCACTDLVLVIFFILPARSLLAAVTYPMVQPDDAGCVNFCRVGLVLYTIIYSLRLVYNATHFFDINPLQQWITTKSKDDNSDTLPPPVRAFSWFFMFFFDYIPSVFAIISVYLFKKHDIMFNENPYYTRQSD
ncbi:hypothetical protein TVAG_003690 [Trichomonas vaginalis G3]|uniref:Integral membrane protein n=1 Tax=Trichomonas vaginalis (strain ATCC PRA-98 / G3) TaxID=412133 RepID=A2E583_TRIV3|nr:hypothetical protein TVAGG3_0475730 [Trichomonas vaginalis G3]EAY12163.1 hypothetical protein TVAG_003690 [Trichomonas vaginalis G3]KAI5515384.1 hypothetical protein TVAGG3_0475730 [Trichomonas vaginalis G3]|eukprot:XP_001324386.1 hypothetical protein [Trichomonas vaginalis G3]